MVWLQRSPCLLRQIAIYSWSFPSRLQEVESPVDWQLAMRNVSLGNTLNFHRAA
jgi:hypothetical protein